jgi:ABC-type transport system involved in multi-copper enzyme maturation permease subunit
VTVGQLGTNLWTPIVSTIVLIVAAVAVSIWSFNRQEL